MTKEAQRIAIAEALGWEVVNNTLCNVRPDKHGDPELEPVADLPDYLNDLNAMHEAEKLLSDPQRLQYLRCFCAYAKMHNISNEPTIDEICCICFATAAQRAEALLRTIGKWEESPEPKIEP